MNRIDLEVHHPYDCHFKPASLIFGLVVPLATPRAAHVESRLNRVAFDPFPLNAGI
jgi:hypothetical protein